MKKVFSILFAAGIIAMVACGSGAEQKTEAPAGDSTAVAATPAATDSAATAATPAATDSTAATSGAH